MKGTKRPMLVSAVVLTLLACVGCNRPTPRGLRLGLGEALLSNRNGVASALCRRDDVYGLMGPPDAERRESYSLPMARVVTLDPASPVERGEGKAAVEGLAMNGAREAIPGAHCHGTVSFHYAFYDADNGVSRAYDCEVTDLVVVPGN